jgi:DNA-binding NtrC family response regulator
MKTAVKIFVVDDDPLIAQVLKRALATEGYTVLSETSPSEIVPKIISWSPDVVMLDIRMPERNGMEILGDLMAAGVTSPVVMLTADDTAETAVKAMKLGAADYLTKPFNVDELKIVVRNIVERARLKQEVDYLRSVSARLFEPEIVGDSPAMRDLRERIGRLAEASVSTVLIAGESGTGKELFARYAHRLLRGTGTNGAYTPFIKVNCAALPESLLESELFGYTKGAFTDAKADKKGLFEQAQGGSILLDEVGEMHPNLQSKLLRVLEERTVRRIGGSSEIPVAVTVIATTNRDLPAMVEEGQFRMDLYYRLNAFSLRVPPLRERHEDIPVLARHFLRHFGEKYHRRTIKSISPEAEACLSAHPWRGNVRELKNVIERIVVLESGDRILPEHLPSDIITSCPGGCSPSRSSFSLPEAGISLEAVERDLIAQALARTGNNKAQAARLLNITYDALRYQVKKFGLE